MFLKNTAKIEIGQIKNKIPILKHVFQGISRLTTSSYTVCDSHSVSRNSFPSHFNATKIIPLHEHATTKTYLTSTKTYWSVLYV